MRQDTLQVIIWLASLLFLTSCKTNWWRVLKVVQQQKQNKNHENSSWSPLNPLEHWHFGPSEGLGKGTEDSMESYLPSGLCCVQCRTDRSNTWLLTYNEYLAQVSSNVSSSPKQILCETLAYFLSRTARSEATKLYVLERAIQHSRLLSIVKPHLLAIKGIPDECCGTLPPSMMYPMDSRYFAECSMSFSGWFSATDIRTRNS